MRLDLAGRDLMELEVVPEELSYIKLDDGTAMKAAAASSDEQQYP